jgi:hypothetical protein
MFGYYLPVIDVTVDLFPRVTPREGKKPSEPSENIGINSFNSGNDQGENAKCSAKQGRNTTEPASNAEK